ncbi:unnamed protein product [Calypogeia fissa]
MGRVALVLLLTIVSPLLFCREVRAGLCSELISPNGYSCREYQATTDDGFILGIQNIPNTGPPVLLVHGLMGGGDNYVVTPPSQSLAFILSNAGYDVWIGNNRCIQWSGGHVSYGSSSDEYWAWTYDELSSYDLTALTAFVYNQRGPLFYIGHSQGTLMLLAGLTGGVHKSEVRGYLKAAVFLAPVASVGHVTATLTKIGLSIYADEIFPAIGVQEFDTNIFADLACMNLSLTASLCRNGFDDILGNFIGTDNYVDVSRIQYFNKFFPQSTSSANINHYGQSYRSNSFQFYDKGTTPGNLAAYGQSQPPSYDLLAFPSSLPLQIWSGGLDGLADPTDVASLLGKLPNSNLEAHHLASYGHFDFVIGTQSCLDIYPYVMQFFQANG